MSESHEGVVDTLRQCAIIESKNHFSVGRESAHFVKVARLCEREILFSIDDLLSIFCCLLIVAHSVIHACLSGIDGIEIELAGTTIIVVAAHFHNGSNHCVVGQKAFSGIEVLKNVLISTLEGVDILVGQIERFGIRHAIFSVRVGAIVRAEQTHKVEMEESTKAISFTTHQL